MNACDINILVACEESQAVATAFRKRGFNAFSCDIQPCSGGHPEYHYQTDVLELLNRKWHLVIAHPPCTYLSLCGNRWFDVSKYGDKALTRIDARRNASAFFMRFVNCAPHWAIENPIGAMSRLYRKPDQIIQPYFFGDSFRKSTCLWLGGLPLLVPTDLVDQGESVCFPSGKRMPKWYADCFGLPPEERARIRSKTFQGIANAMAEQWGNYLLEIYNNGKLID